MASNGKHNGNGHANGVNGHGNGVINDPRVNGHGNGAQGTASTALISVPRFALPVTTSRKPSKSGTRRESQRAAKFFCRMLAPMQRSRRNEVIRFMEQVCEIAPSVSEVGFRRATRSTIQSLDSYRRVPETMQGVWVLGSARFQEGSVQYEAIRALTRIHTQATLGYWPIIQGGGPGAMQAGAHGGCEGGAHAVGMQLQLQHEEAPNPHSDYNARFTKFGPRKQRMLELTMLGLGYPGGYGTQDEIWEVLCMMQCLKSPRVPFYLVGHRFWFDQMRHTTAAQLRAGTISVKDLELFSIVDLHHPTIAPEDQKREVLEVAERLPGHEDERPALRVIGTGQWLREVANHLNGMNPGFDQELHGQMVDCAISRVADVHMPSDW